MKTNKRIEEAVRRLNRQSAAKGFAAQPKKVPSLSEGSGGNSERRESDTG